MTDKRAGKLALEEWTRERGHTKRRRTLGVAKRIHQQTLTQLLHSFTGKNLHEVKQRGAGCERDVNVAVEARHGESCSTPEGVIVNTTSMDTTAGPAGASMLSAARDGDLALYLDMTPLRLLRTRTFED